MEKLQITVGCKTGSTCVLLALLLTGCYSNTAEYSSNASDTSMKMRHHTTVLNAETQPLVETMVESLSEVNFEYEVVTTQ